LKTVSENAVSAPNVTSPRPASALEVDDRTNEPSVVVIEPLDRSPLINFAELRRYRELFGYLVWRDLLVRYKQTALGVAWALLQPILTILVFSIFFGRFGRMSELLKNDQALADIPYFLYAFSGIVPWMFMSNAVTQGGNSLIQNGHLVGKVYFPRLLVPAGSVAAGLLDAAISAAMMLLLLAWFGKLSIVGLPMAALFFALIVVTALGVAVLLSSAISIFRDIRHLLNFITQLWMFASPIAYPLEIVPTPWRWLFALNPMVGLLSGFRGFLLGIPVDWVCVVVSLLSAAAIIRLGLGVFRSVERRLADLI
jgi:lipopolysaccharide transport system permease protein